MNNKTIIDQLIHDVIGKTFVLQLISEDQDYDKKDLYIHIKHLGALLNIYRDVIYNEISLNNIKQLCASKNIIMHNNIFRENDLFLAIILIIVPENTQIFNHNSKIIITDLDYDILKNKNGVINSLYQHYEVETLLQNNSLEIIFRKHK